MARRQLFARENDVAGKFRTAEMEQRPFFDRHRNGDARFVRVEGLLGFYDLDVLISMVLIKLGHVLDVFDQDVLLKDLLAARFHQLL